MDKVKKLKCIIGISAIIAILAGGFFLLRNFMGIYGLCDKYRYEVLEIFFGNPMNIHCVDYDYLAPKFKNIISKEDYYSLNNDKDILEIYKKFSEVNNSQSHTTSITTDGFRQYAGGRITIDNVEYSVINHIDFRVHWGKIQIVRWYVDIQSVTKE